MTVLAAVFALGVGRFAFGAAGSEPPHTKGLTDNEDGTYTLSLDVVGESERKPNPVNVIVILDHSGSMDTRTGGSGSQTRMTAAQNAVNGLARSLYAYNTSEFPNLVQMALVGFSTTGAVTQGPTNSYNTFSSAVNRLDADGGTNWEDALQDAAGINFNDSDPTYVIFVSDGNPTFRNTRGNYNPLDNYYYNSYRVYGNGSDSQAHQGIPVATTITRCYDHAVDDARTLATAIGADHFYTIGAYGNVDRMQSLTTDAGAPAGNYFSAANTTDLQNALAAILAKIEKAGIGSVEIEDGTTNQVSASSGVVELLEVDTSSFKYYRDGVEWKSTDTPAPPAAQFVDGAVEWDLSSLGVLDNGVKYTVTFDCYPSQYTYDTIARLKNGDKQYSELDPEIQKYIVDNGNGTYSLRTNTTATLDWDDTRTDDDEEAVAYVNPDPVRTDSSTLTALKEWEGEEADTDSLEMTILMDDAPFHTTEMTKASGWTTSSFISPGIIKGGKVLDGAEGHDFKFAELDDTQYHWELETPTVHPMLVDGTLTMLVKVDTAHPAPSGAQTYTINGATYYVDSSSAGLKAVNHRRSNLNLTKVVTGEDAPEDATFPFTLTVDNSKAPETEPTDDPDHNSDFWLWFSIYDTKAGATVTNATVSGATGPNAKGYYYAPSGSAISVQMKDGWNLRFTNLPSGTTYTFAEGDLADGFAFNKAELTSGEDSTFKGAKTTTGTIENTKSSYYVTYTNDYALTDLEITKKWEDNSNQDGIRPTAEEFASMLTLEPAVDGKTPTVVVDSEDSNKYIISYTGLPRFNNGKEVDYTVTEEVPEGYQPTETSAKDHGTITNPHTPEVTKVTVVKAWNDQDDIGKIRPASINAQLTADGTASGDPVALNADNEWTYTWENLPKYKDGKAIEYSADETAVPAGYEKTGPVKTETDTGVTFTVTNTYNPTPVSVDPPVQKVITGNDDLYNKGDFTFTIEAVNPTDAPMPENTSITNSADYEFEGKTGFYEFGEITFTKPGTYEYLVKESGSVAGVTNDPDAASGKTLTFTVTDDGTGKLVVNPTTDQVQLSFTNVYNAAGEASIVVSKEITGAAWPAGKTLTLTIAGADGAPMPEATTATLTSAGSVTFGPIKYGLSDKDKEYTYTITEDSFGDGWSGSPASVKATVKVSDNGDGTLKADVTYDPTDAKFTNTYKATGKATLEVEKKLEGAAWPEDKTLTMTLAGQDGAPMPAEGGESVELTAADKATFGEIAYTEADAGKTYTYKISEGNGFGAGWTGSGDVTATVVVTDNGNGTLATKVTYTPEDATITNTYKATGEIELFAGKKLDAAESLNAPDVTGKYTLTLEAQDGAPMPEGATDGKVEIKNADGDGTMTTFGKIAFTEADAGKTYTYKVTETGTVAGVENGTAEYTVTVKVTDNGNGTLKAEVAEGSKNTLFTNTYKVEPVEASFPVKKVISVPEGLKGPAEWSYTIDVAAGEGAPEAETMTGTVDQDNDTANFGPFKFTAPGEYTYTVTETGTVAGITNDADATTGKTVTITVVDNGDGTMTATADSTENNPVTFTNTYSVEPTTAQFPVKKIMSVPDGADGPSKWSYTIDVAAGEGAPEADAMTGTVDQDNDTVTFGDFTYTEPGTYTYTVTETGEVAGVTNDSAAETGKTVTVTVVDNGNGTLTATADSTTDKPVSFTNTYAAEGTAVPVATKVAQGFELTDGQFSFELKDAEGNVLQTATNDADGNVTFEPIPYTAAGTYNYTINEVVIDGDDIADDTHVCDVTVTVTDKGDGTLEATIDYSNNTFTNKHTDNEKTVESGKAETYVDGELVEAGDTLTYTITYANNTAGVATVTVEDTIPANTTYVEGSASDGGVYAGGTITWSIENVPAGGTGSVTFEVTVDDAAAGTTLENTGKVSDGENDSSTNSVTTSVPVKDVKEGGESVDGEGVQVGDTLTYEVSFTLTEDATSVVVTDNVPAHTTFVSADNDGVLADGTITWDLGALAAGDYTVSFDVTVDESAVTVDAITNTASINVNNHGEVKTNTVTNTPETGGLEISKTVEVPEGFELDEDKAFTFTVTLKDQNGDPLEREYAYTGDYEGTIKSGGTVTLKHGESITIAGLPALAQYSITEADEDGYTPTSATLEGTIPEGGTGSATAAFVNVYNANPATLKIAAEKNLVVPEGLTGPADWSYDIAVEALGGAPEVETMSGTVTKANPTITFGDFSFTKPGEYQYTVTESGTVPGVTNGTEAYTVRVNVVDNKDGTLTATANYDDKNPVVFTNTYSVEPLTVKQPVSVDKWLTGTNLAAGMFEFKIEGVTGDEPLPTNATTTNDAKGIVTFDDITFEEPGEYHYVVSEIDSQNPGYTYDKNTVDVTITVVDNGDGTMSATTTYGEKTEFDNSYEANGEAQFFAKKNLTGRALEDGQFTFELVDADGKVIQTKTNNGSGQVSFDAIAYTQEDLLKAESAATDDSASGAVTTDEGATAEGAADATTTDDAAVTEATTNESSDDQNEADGAMEPQGAAADAAIDEAVAGAPEDEATEPEANEAADEAVAEESAPAGAPAAEADAPAAKPGSPEYADSATFTYTIREVNDGAAGYTYDTHEETVTVVVTDDGDGNMTAKVTYDEDGAEFTNAYEAEGEAQFNGTKTVTGIELEEGLFTFELKDADNNVLSTATNAADGSFSFAPVNYYQNADQHDADTGTFTYYITEVNDGRLGYTYDSHQATVTVTVTDNGDGTLATEVVYGDGDAAAFNNPYKPLATSAPIRAKKALEGRSLKAGEFTFELSDANGKVVATATNTASGIVDFGTIAFDEVGTYTFTAVEVEGSDSHITYDTSVKTFTVEVVDVDGQLEATVTCDDETATFENVYTPDQPKKGKKKVPPVVRKLLLPTTGDPMAAGSVMTLSAIGAAALLTGLNRRSKRK